MRRRIPALLAGALWCFVYGSALELLRIFVFEKLPKLQQLDQLEAELRDLRAERDALIAARASS